MILQSRRMALTKQADTVFAKAVRARNRCEIAPLFPVIECGGWFECCHILNGRHHSIRWAEDAALCGCVEHHRFGTLNPAMWRSAMVQLLGDDYYELRRRDREDPPEDPRDVINRYRKGGSE